MLIDSQPLFADRKPIWVVQTVFQWYMNNAMPAGVLFNMLENITLTLCLINSSVVL